MHTYRCAQCGDEFESDASEAEVRAEQKANGWDAESDLAVVCDDCYQSMIQQLPPRVWNTMRVVGQQTEVDDLSPEAIHAATMRAQFDALMRSDDE